jgi:DNA primase large subunit
MCKMLTIKDYANYPFLHGAANSLKSIPDLQKPIVKIIETDFGKNSLTITKERLSNAIYNTKHPIKGILPEEEIASFFFARVILSTQVHKSLIEKFVNYEANKFYRHYCKEQRLKRQEIEKDLQISFNKTTFTLAEYIPIATKLIQTSARWKLVNMNISDGLIDISKLSQNKFDTKTDSPEILFFKEQIKYKLRSTLPMKIDKETKLALEPLAQEIFGVYYSSTENVGYGEVTASNFPPCIQRIIDMNAKHENPTHSGRFALATFLHEIGMSDTEIISTFQTVRDFDLSQTIYQVEHITGKQGTPAYKCPACDTMRTNGLCLGKNNALCNKVKHPLGYYQAKHKFSLKEKTLQKSSNK